MDEITKKRKINDFASLLAVKIGDNSIGQIIVCSDHKIRVKRNRLLKYEATVTVLDKTLKEGDIAGIIKINSCRLKPEIKYRIEIIDAQNLKIVLEN